MVIDVKQQKVSEILSEFHKRAVSRFKKENAGDVLLKQSRIIEILYEDHDIEPSKCAEKLNDRFGYNLRGNDVIAVFRSIHLGNPVERSDVMQWADNVATLFGKVLAGDKNAYSAFDTERRKALLKIDGRRNPQNYVVANFIYIKYPELNLHGDADIINHLPILMGKFFFYELVGVVEEVYGFAKLNNNSSIKEIKLDYEQAKRKIIQLENQLERTNFMLQELQDDFDEQIASVKVMELTEFFASLNSDKYGCILDELLLLRKGVDDLRNKNFEIPLELNGILILVKKMIQFVKDSHINPMMKINEIKKVKASDVEYCNYDGSPFITKDAEKLVQVISPGWLYKDKEIQISRPRFKEVETSE